MTVNPPEFERVLLIGFMGSGKSTVGPLLADALGWAFVDTDARIETDTGRSIPQIFELDGEQGFRVIESRTVREALEGSGVVIASGGGWATISGNWDDVPGGTLTVWLDVSVETVSERLSGDPAERPLLASEDAFDQARTLLERRRPAYSRAKTRVPVDGRTPAEIASHIESLVVTGVT